MKKSFAITLAILTLCLTACGGSESSQEKNKLYEQPLYYIEDASFGYYVYDSFVEIDKYLGDTTEELNIPHELTDSYTSKLKPVKIIGRSAFRSRKELKIINIPDTVMRIDEGAFLNCSSLESLTIGKSVEKIGASAFSGTALRAVDIPSSVKIIDGRAFADCTYLKEVNLGEGVSELKYEAFSGCTALSTVKGGENLMSADDDIFLSVPWFEGKTEEFFMLGNVLIKYNGTESQVEIPENTTGISNVFSGNAHITKVSLPDTLQHIGAEAFEGCTSLSKINTDNIKYAGNNAFSQTPYLKDLKTDSNGFGIIGDGILLKYTGSEKNIIIPKNVKYISDAFENNTSIISVTLGKNTEALGTDSFSGCTKLNSVTVSEALEYIDEFAFIDCGITEFNAGKNKYANDWATRYGLSNIIAE